MKTLVATKETQGRRGRLDFCWCREGEIVFPNGVKCHGGRWDDYCGCRRAWGGIESRRSTTTAKVAEVADDTLGTLVAIARASAEKAGWSAESGERALKKMLRVAAKFEVGAVVEFGPKVAARATA